MKPLQSLQDPMSLSPADMTNKAPVSGADNTRFKNLAIRQYLHNDGDGLVFGYNKELTDAYIEHQAQQIEQYDQFVTELLAIVEGVEELNMSNYDHALVDQLNDGMNEVDNFIRSGRKRISEL